MKNEVDRINNYEEYEIEDMENDYKIEFISYKFKK